MGRLVKIVQGNGIYSALSGAILAIGAPWLDTVSGVEAWVLAVVGVGLIAYGTLIYRQARNADPVPVARFATAMDLAWLVGAAALLIGFPSAMTTAGKAILVAASVGVGAFAALQFRELRTAR